MNQETKNLQIANDKELCRRVDYIPWVWKEKKWRNWSLGLLVVTAVLQIIWYLRTNGNL